MIKKLLAGLALAFCSYFTLPLQAEEAAVAEEFFVPVEWCDQLESVGFPVGWCYPNLQVTNAVSGVTGSSVTVSGATDRATGTMHVYVSDDCINPPSEASMATGVGAVRYDPFTLNGTNFTRTIESISSPSVLCVYMMHEWERRYSDIKMTDAFVLFSNTAVVPDYFVDSVNGNDSNTGLSKAQAWKTLTKLNSTATGTSKTVCLWDGSVFEDQQLEIRLSGTANDRTIYGTCGDNGGGIQWYQIGVNDGWMVQAEVNGTYEFAGCRATNPTTCKFGSPGTNTQAVPATIWQGLVDARFGAQYYDIRGIRWKDSAGRIFRIDETYTTPSYARIIDNTAHTALASGFQGQNLATNSGIFVDNNTFEYVVLQRVDGITTGWPNSMNVFSNSSDRAVNVIFQNNKILKAGGEGYGARGVKGVLVRGNGVAENRNVMYYADGAKNVIFEYNWGIGKGWYPTDPTNAFHSGTECYGPELTHNTADIMLRNNLFVNLGNTTASYHNAYGILISVEGNPGCTEPWKSQGWDPRALGYQVSLHAVNNTFIFDDPLTPVMGGFGLTVNNNIGVFEVKNNIFAGSVTCPMPSAPGIDVGWNLFDSQPSNSICRGQNSQYGSSGLVNDPSWDADNIPDFNSLVLPAGSAALNDGINLKTILSFIDVDQFPQFYSIVSKCVDQTEQEWEFKNGGLDYYCNLRPTTQPNIGHSANKP